jgi:muramoyltetrapeptide carboxypeptidase
MKYRVQIIAPSSGVNDADRLAMEFANLLMKYDFQVKPPLGLFAENMHYYANATKKRLEQLQSALLDPEIDIIWTFRGGYGASELAIQCIDLKPSHPKILIGYSDITVLHCLFNEVYKMPSIHGPVATSLLGDQAKHIDDIVTILNGKESRFQLEPMTQKVKDFEFQGPIAGGNLSVIVTTIGTKLHLDTKGKILVIEDVGEKGYSVRRMLNHCSQARLFDDVGAIIFGDFTKSDEHLNFAFEDFCARNSHIPMFKAHGIGHGETNIPLVFGYDAAIKRGELTARSPFKPSSPSSFSALWAEH